MVAGGVSLQWWPEQGEVERNRADRAGEAE